MDRQIVKVYVRAGSNKGERLLSFQPPNEVPQSEWLERGFAFDGNSVVASVTAKTYVAKDSKTGQQWISDFHGQEGILPGEWAVSWSLTKALQDVEGWLVKWLESLGYGVEFA